MNNKFFHRFFIDTKLSLKQEIILPNHIIQHIKSLRLKNKDNIILFNGNNKEYLTEITYQKQKQKQKQIQIIANIINEQSKDRESKIKINLIQAIPKINKFEFIIQKSTELGINNIYPIITSRSNFKNDKENILKKKQRWNDITISACEQCGRNKLPIIHQIKTLDEILDITNNNYKKFLLSTNNTKKLSNNNNEKNEEIFIFIGPEGGITSDEENLLIKYNFQPISLGPRILRVETATIAAISFLHSKYGDFI